MEYRCSSGPSSPPLSPVSQSSGRSGSPATPQSESATEAKQGSAPSITEHVNLSGSPSLEPQKPSIVIPKIMSDLRPPENSLDQQIVASLEGKCVDEFGNILNWDGTVLGRVEGDLPSMIGRPVQKDGKILDTAGDVAGHVSETFVESHGQDDSETGKDKLKIDQDGTIYDQNGEVVGKMKNHLADGGGSQNTTGCQHCKFRDSRRSNADRTDNTTNNTTNPAPVTPSPSEIYLDVKSTHDGIQLIIKIPTVLNSSGHDTWKCTIEKDD